MDRHFKDGYTPTLSPGDGPWNHPDSDGPIQYNK